MLILSARVSHIQLIQSMASGRPVMLRRHEIDCQFPDDDDAEVNEDGSTTTQGCQSFYFNSQSISSYPDKQLSWLSSLEMEV